MNTSTPPLSDLRPGSFNAEYWSQRFSSEPYLEEGDRFEDFEPAYRFGHSLQGEVDDMDSRETEWEERWERFKADCRLSWRQAKNAVRTAWRHAEFEAEVKMKSISTRFEERVHQAVQRFEDNVRDRPAEHVLGAAVAGFVAARLPLRSVVMSSIGIASAAAPAALLFLGMWKVADHLLGSRVPSPPVRPVPPAWT
ncbi:MAG TPA: hypothetical protein VHM91_00025 [Verrucomicrobiales bacterium]|nr:hypothetical protein [Verrucomicrobiales bacterium]